MEVEPPTVFIAELPQCSICAMVCTPPVKGCGTNHHPLCAKCLDSMFRSGAVYKVPTCPLCRVSLLEPAMVRLKDRELACHGMLALCEYGGCEALVPYHELENHRQYDCVCKKCVCNEKEEFRGSAGHGKTCRYSSMVCLVANCKWNGKREDYGKHLREMHVDSFQRAMRTNEKWKANRVVETMHPCRMTKKATMLGNRKLTISISNTYYEDEDMMMVMVARSDVRNQFMIPVLIYSPPNRGI
jgi:hypothetical protein